MPKELTASIVRIIVGDLPIGIGFFVEQNIILTCAHVVKNCAIQEKINLDLPLVSPGDVFSGHLIYKNDLSDVACIETLDCPENVSFLNLLQIEEE